MHADPPKQWDWSGLVAVAAGLYALLTHEGLGWWIFAGIPGALVLMSGAALLLMPGEQRITGYMALGGALGVLCALPMWMAGGFGAAMTATLLFGASFVVAGRIALRAMPPNAEVPPPLEDWRLHAKVACDEAVLAYFLGTAALPSGEAARRVCAEVKELDQVLADQGWLARPETYHRMPSAPEHVKVTRDRIFGQDYERLSIDSGFQPHRELPGAAQWMRHENNHRSVANLMRHAGPARPWIVCLHGYRMGLPLTDFSMFPPAFLHHRLGLNVLMPLLPLHGLRKIGWRTGDRYLDGNLVELLHAQTQALWDLRRWMAWLRQTEGEVPVGAYGVSLGGYNAALLALYDASLEFIVVAVPVVDLAGVLWRYMPSAHRTYFGDSGIDETRAREILSLVSPVRVPAQLPRERLQVVGGVADRIVPPAQSLLLSRHWGVPVQWFQGSHLSMRRESEPARAVESAVQAAGWSADARVLA